MRVPALLLLALSACTTIDLEAQCRDGRVNGPETDLDCGGPCLPCAVGALCLGDADCGTGVCTLNRCAEASCVDGVRNQDEVEADCGGPCAPCGAADACRNGRRDGLETGVDCGGPCQGCPLGSECVRNTDCLAGVCFDGACRPGACAPPLVGCAGTCVDTRVDPLNCGGCGIPCQGDLACIAGACRPVCTGGTQPCGNACVDLGSDPQHCGACPTACPQGNVCVGGNCFAPCAQNEIPCGGVCVAVDRDPLHCGGCGMPCPPGSGCVGGQCVAGCSPPLQACNAGSLCVDSRFDPEHCGGCNTPCPAVPNANRACTPMGCGRSVCQPGFEDCDGMPGNGCEEELGVSQQHCGRCGRSCIAADTCVLGRCCGALPAGSYQATCTNCSACDGTLSCLCNDAMSIPRPTSIPLQGCLGSFTNCDGVLLCNGC